MVKFKAELAFTYEFLNPVSINNKNNISESILED
uniref:Uncharacterized protein n=1 Tax=Anguilla anguilla TaxID=7936 RepID=A0A0E9QKD9_ANGAN